MLRRIGTAGSLAIVLIASVLIGASAAAKLATVEVQTGAVHPDDPSKPYEYTRFYPDVIRVHRGQTIRWRTVGTAPAAGFHTITFAKSRPPFFRADEIPETYAATDAWAFGSNCGRNGLPACVLKASTKFLSSGVPPFGSSPFEVKVDAPPGRYKFFCTVHPGMSGAVEVVTPRKPVPSQRQVKAQIASEVRRDSRAADALFRADQRPVSSVDAEGRRVWRVLLGDSTVDDHVSLIAFLPTNLNVSAGDRVRYEYRSRIVNEIHSVTFPAEAVSVGAPVPTGLGDAAIFPACDPDAGDGGLPGVRGLWNVPGGLNCPTTLELLLSPWTTTAHPAPGNQVPTRLTYHDSGFLVPAKARAIYGVLPDTGRVLPSRFDAEFPAPGTFSYQCEVHVVPMTGSINVS